ncbi:MAG: uroporphyrinogen decarboxylase, partial [Verrucomicrobiales bacterium]|nr:uroporphyrinogen decarboxylase [Verrucomicrobiales bacterium]
VFDTLAGSLPAPQFEHASGRWLRRIVAALTPRVPVILFAKSAPVPWPDLAALRPHVLGVDAHADLAHLRATIPAHLALQGNLAPEVLLGPEEGVVRETRRILETLRGRPGHLFNLGHGVPPDAPLTHLETLVNTIRTFS